MLYSRSPTLFLESKLFLIRLAMVIIGKTIIATIALQTITLVDLRATEKLSLGIVPNTFERKCDELL